jgi:GNAT superfamily N-acetyltransferase
MDLLIRPATPEDAPALAAVEVATWQAAYRGLMPDAYLDRLSREVKAEIWGLNLLKHQHTRRKRVLVAVQDDEIIGFTRLGPAEDTGTVGLVSLLYVLPEHWGCGVGKALMEAAMQQLRELGMDQAVLWVLRDNLRARRFYESLGWRPDGRTSAENYGGVELEALCYRRTVA